MGTGAHMTIPTPQLLPEWLALVGTVLFLAVAASHLRHLVRTAGQRRAWHACHVLAAIGMAFMYGPAAVDPLAVPTGFWLAVFTCAGAIAALWALTGVGRVPTLMWLLTSIDLAAMIYMWSPGSQQTPLSWLLVAYFVAQSGLWACDAYRRIDGRTPVISWSLMAGPGGGAGVGIPTARTAQTGTLLGELDIGVSMLAMTLGMGYMLVVMLAA